MPFSCCTKDPAVSDCQQAVGPLRASHRERVWDEQSGVFWKPLLTRLFLTVAPVRGVSAQIFPAGVIMPDINLAVHAGSYSEPFCVLA